MRLPVEMTLTVGQRAYEAPSLGASLGWICPFSFASEVPNPEDGPASQATYLHECFHYQQLVSTPFGFHLALTDWLASLRISKMLLSLRQGNCPFVEIPLVWAAVNGGLSEGCTEAVVEAAGAGDYLNWLLGSGIHSDASLRHCVDFFSQSPLILCSRMGSRRAVKRLESSVTPSFPRAEEGRSINGTVVTTNDILENCATVGTQSFEAHAWSLTVDEFVDSVAANKPPNYSHLVREIAGLFGSELKGYHSLGGVRNVELLSVICCVISDLSLCGPCLPEKSQKSGCSSWEDIHPAWRFVRIYDTLRADAECRREFFASVSNRDELHGFVDRFARSLKWTPPSLLHRQVDWQMFRVLGVPFTWAVDLFQSGIRARGDRVLLPPVAGYLQAVDRFLDSYLMDAMDAQQAPTGIKDIIHQLMGDLAPPFAALKSGEGYFSLGGKQRSFAISVYYLSYFTKCMMYSSDLNYGVAFVDPAEVRNLFEGIFSYSPDDFYVAESPL